VIIDVDLTGDTAVIGLAEPEDCDDTGSPIGAHVEWAG